MPSTTRHGVHVVLPQWPRALFLAQVRVSASALLSRVRWNLRKLRPGTFVAEHERTVVYPTVGSFGRGENDVFDVLWHHLRRSGSGDSAVCPCAVGFPHPIPPLLESTKCVRVNSGGKVGS